MPGAREGPYIRIMRGGFGLEGGSTGVSGVSGGDAGAGPASKAESPAGSGPSVATRAGYVALIGLPNVGKSSLLNAFIGERLSIVTPRAQTTRERVLGIYTSDGAQMIFVDTPGLLEPRYLLHHSMLEAARAALSDADLVVLLLDATAAEPPSLPADVLGALRSRRGRAFVAINKIDAAAPGGIEALRAWARSELDLDAFEISALTGEGVDELRAALIGALPVSRFFYPEDDLAVQPVRFFVAELIRETIFEAYREEIPYSTAVAIEEFRESEDPIYIRAVIHVERDSQKAILIGKEGAAIRELGKNARAKVEAFVGARVYLDLWVKTLPRWRRNRAALERLGYPVPPEAKRRPGRKR